MRQPSPEDKHGRKARWLACRRDRRLPRRESLGDHGVIVEFAALGSTRYGGICSLARVAQFGVGFECLLGSERRLPFHCPNALPSTAASKVSPGGVSIRNFGDG